MEPTMIEVPRVLCVDDEPALLASVARNLRRRYRVTTCESGQEALEILRHERDFTVILSDMRMPGMDGAEFFAHARLLAPNAVRILLTGQADMTTVLNAINDGRIFRFINKPIEKEQLLAVIDSAAAQHRMLLSEKEVVDQTLYASLELVFEMIALCNPVLSARSQRVARIAIALSEGFGLSNTWTLHAAAALSEVGLLALSPALRAKVLAGEPLWPPERALADHALATLPPMLRTLTLLDPVREIVEALGRKPSAASQASVGTRIVRVAQRFDSLQVQGLPFGEIVAALSADSDCDPRVVASLPKLRALLEAAAPRQVPVAELQSGMVVRADIVAASGEWLAAKGQEVTPALLRRLEQAAERGELAAGVLASPEGRAVGSASELPSVRLLNSPVATALASQGLVGT